MGASKLTARTTVYLNPYIKKFIQHKAVEESRSASSIINNRLADLLEYLASQKSKNQNSKTALEFESILQKAGLSYDDLRDK